MFMLLEKLMVRSLVYVSSSIYKCKGSTSRDVLREVLAGDTVDFLLEEREELSSSRGSLYI